MAKIRGLSIVVTLGLALLTTASPAAAYIIEALTSISADVAADKATLEKGIQAAVVDVARERGEGSRAVAKGNAWSRRGVTRDPTCRPQ